MPENQTVKDKECIVVRNDEKWYLAYNHELYKFTSIMLFFNAVEWLYKQFYIKSALKGNNI
jgi:hypothetical protein